MSFSWKVKEELSRHLGRGRHCQLAELAALLVFGGELKGEERENAFVREKCGLLEECLFGAAPEPSGQRERRILEAVRLSDGNGRAAAQTVDGLLIQQSCCRRAYIRGAFLAGGSINDPRKSYHFEIVCKNEGQAGQLRDVINGFGMDAKIVGRKGHQVVYLKEGAQIVDILNVMEAHVALMDLENVRIVKEMRNSLNRQVNCEAANIGKTVNAAVKQVEDIHYISRTAGLSSLPENLQEIAMLRLEYPDAPLKELGSYLNPPVGKSGANHRLRRIGEIAERLREESSSIPAWDGAARGTRGSVPVGDGVVRGTCGGDPA